MCSHLPLLTTCRLPFDFCRRSRNLLPEYSLPPLITLPNLLNTTYLRTLTIGINSSRFLERLLECIPSIQNLSVGINDELVNDKNLFDTMRYVIIYITHYNENNLFRFPSGIDPQMLSHLSRLSLNCLNNISFHRTIAIFSCVFVQLKYFSLKLQSYELVCDPFIISGDTIQQLCIDRLNPSSIYALNLLFSVEQDANEKIIFNSFVKSPFTIRKYPPVIIVEDRSHPIGYSNQHRFIVYTVPYNGNMLQTIHFPLYSERYELIYVKE